MPIAPSPIEIRGKVYVEPMGFIDHVRPRAATKSDIHRIVEDFRKAAHRAKDAGFDGVELHSSSGYLLD